MKKPISIALAFLLLFSSIGMAKSSHICMGEETMNEFGLVTKHLNCGMDTESLQNPSHSEQSIDPVACCQNQFELLQSDVDQSLKIVHLDTGQFIFIAAFTQIFILGIEPFPAEFSFTPFSSPPLIHQDFNILYQTFLI